VPHPNPVFSFVFCATIPSWQISLPCLFANLVDQRLDSIDDDQAGFVGHGWSLVFQPTCDQKRCNWRSQFATSKLALRSQSVTLDSTLRFQFGTLKQLSFGEVVTVCDHLVMNVTLDSSYDVPIWNLKAFRRVRSGRSPNLLPSQRFEIPVTH
jgi:hypothetical protein